MWALLGHLCSNGIWQGFCERTDNKKTFVEMILNYVLKNIDTILGSIVNTLGRAYKIT